MRNGLHVLVMLALASPAHAQFFKLDGFDRFELGRRVRAFEEAWDGQTDTSARKRAAETVEPVTVQFFSLRFAEVGRTLDRSRLALSSEKAPEAKVEWAEALTIRQASQLLDVSATELPFKIERFSSTKAAVVEGAEARFYLHKPGDKPGKPVLTLPLKQVPAEGKLPLKGLAEGEYLITMEVSDGKSLLARQTNYPLSLVADLTERLAKLEKAHKGLPEEKQKSLHGATVGYLHELLTKLARKEIQETGYPASRLLREAEEGVKALADGKGHLGDRKPGEFWVSVPAGRGRSPVRLFAPDAVKKGEPLPLVIALHGAGGSENMFFDACGAGAVVRLCRERGWLVVAPRNGGGLEGLIDEVDRLYPVDRKRVFLIGHSMGAAQALSAVSGKPERYRGVAALGGGGRVKAGEGLKGVSCYVGLGSADGIARGVRAQKEAYEKAGFKELVFREYQGIEHLTIVQVALPDVFAFFDKHAKE